MAHCWGKHVIGWLAIVSLSLFVTSAWGQDAVPEIKRVAVPKTADQDAARKIVLELFRGDYEQAKTAEEKSALAERMLAVGNDTHDDAAGQYMLYQITKELAISVMNTPLALRAVDGQGMYFEIDAAEVKLATVTAIEKTAKLTKDRQVLLATLDQLVDELIHADRYDLAKQATALTLDLARKASDPNAIKQAGIKLKDIETREKLFGDVQAARKVLATKPDDPAANTTVGRFLCLINNDWDAGLPLLAKSGDANLKAAAEKELAQPQEAMQQMEVGDLWWDIADKETGTLQGALQQRALAWYQTALPQLTGLAKLKITGRIEKATPKSDAGAPLASTTPAKSPLQPPKTPMRPAQKLITNSVGMRLVLIPPGSFVMGSPPDESGRGEDETQHRVKLTKPFYMGMTEVTQEQWYVVMKTKPWQGKEMEIPDAAACPVTYVTWTDATEFCRKLSEKEKKTYRLPTEAEWEYACRAGSKGRFCSGEDMQSLDIVGWFGSNSQDGPVQFVGLKQPNDAGLYDMHGNVWEWCSDWWEDFRNKDATDPQGPKNGSMRASRGGSGSSSSSQCRSAERYSRTQSSTYYGLGFRVVYDPQAPAVSAQTKGADATPASLNGTKPSTVVVSNPPQSPLARSLGLKQPQTNTIGMKLAFISPGTFRMGSPAGENGHRENETQHSVKITQPFFMGVTEVTQEQWKTIMGTEPWTIYAPLVQEPTYPATLINWDKANEFCRNLSAKEGKTYRLPTEAEWEYACRAGSPGAFCFGDDLQQLNAYAWVHIADEDRKYPQKVAQKSPNAFGLFDMHGNAGEFCADWFEDYPMTEQTDPKGPDTGTSKVIRGGSSVKSDLQCRAAVRATMRPTSGNAEVGFRVVREP
ncbi:MAG: SUMF1/EgtB/PvdO family nonheme iron enzyme [Planctomycetes bacterium]|nr:SUMF1/EgtB/PvdO family nonheme iron enzyme [Planctomycetota bacterium]